MRHTLLSCLTAALLLANPAAGLGQQPDEIKPEDLRPAKPQRTRIEKVRFGFVGGGVNRPGTAFGDFKTGAWVPVYVDVIVGNIDDLPNGRLVLEAADCDGVPSTYTVPLPPLKKGEQHLALGYVKPSSYDTDITLTIMAGRDRVAERKESPTALDVGNVLVVALGARMQGLVRALAPPRPVQANEEDILVDGSQTQGRFVGYLDDWRQMPSRWFGYESADVVILATGDRNFIQEVLNEHELNKDASRYAALAEWVRRGGRLILFAGQNQDVVAQLDERQPMLPVRPAGTNTDPELGWLLSLAPNQPLRVKDMHFTRFERKAGQEFRFLGQDDKMTGREVLFRGRHGLGQVVVYGFDPERPPFTVWAGQPEFWKRFLEERVPKAVTPLRQGRTFGPMVGETTTELGSQLQQALEDFQDVPVISFGWVALFILLYILIVGPLDYFFLKKVVKRLELTWVTFPVVVVVVSAAAYFTAYYVKGNDQRINKVDLVDIDLHGKQAQLYGQTWFTIFSPRIQHYTVGVEPAAETGWVAPDSTAVTLSWLGRPDNSAMGYRRPRSPGLFRRTYEFEPDASGMKGVPIPVWSTKSFNAVWATTQPAKALLEADLRPVAGNPNQLTGQIVSRLPVTLDDAVLVRQTGSGARVYPLGTLVPGAEKSLANVFKDIGAERQALFDDWANKQLLGAETQQPGVNRPPTSTTAPLLTRALFHGLTQDKPTSTRHNSGLRHLDQTWRLTDREVILFGRVKRQEKAAESMTQDPLSPTRLWLGQLPKAGGSRPALNGTLSQETYVRIFIPVRMDAE